MTYLPIQDYGLVGNLETAALVGRDGSIDWCPLPHVECPSVFARILDDERGGHFAVRPTASAESTQEYVEGTNVLRTRFRTASGTVAVTDFMPAPPAAAEARTTNQALYRHVAGEEGSVDIEVEFEPRFDYARTVPAIERSEHGVAARGDGATAFLSSSMPLEGDDDAATAAVEVDAGEDHWLVLGYDEEVPLRPSEHRDLLDGVVEFWREWGHDCPDDRDCPIAGPHHDLAVRSALALKLLTHADTGAICAAPTTSLPEDVGGVRNWDYRYNWIRDAAFTVRALSELGHVEEAGDYFGLCLDHCGRGEPADVQPVYGLHGNDDVEERTLDHLEGYRGSAPVRVGNAAADQHQLDVYGELVNGVYAVTRYGYEIEGDDWAVLRDVVDYVCDHWDEPDVGIWEVRADPRHFVYSKVMCWVALDRGIRIVEETRFDGPTERWTGERQAIREAVLERGYSERADSFVRSFGEEDTLDATGLLIPVVGFLPFDDERVRSTIDATLTRLCHGDGLVARYEGDDGLPGEEGAFVICSFWLVTALARSGRVEEATALFEDVLEFVGPLGLLAEQVDPGTGALLGNYPQAFSHIGLINAVISLRRAREGGLDGSEPQASTIDAAAPSDGSTDRRDAPRDGTSTSHDGDSYS